MKGLKGWPTSILNSSSSTFPNTILAFSGLLWSSKMKFFTEAFFTFPPKFNMYPSISSFHSGFLFVKTIILSLFAGLSYSSDSETSSENFLVPSKLQYDTFGDRIQTLKFLGRADPKKLVQYSIVAIKVLKGRFFSLASEGLQPGPKMLYSLPVKFPFSFPIQCGPFSVKSFLLELQIMVELALLEVSLAEKKYQLLERQWKWKRGLILLSHSLSLRIINDSSTSGSRICLISFSSCKLFSPSSSPTSRFYINLPLPLLSSTSTQLSTYQLFFIYQGSALINVFFLFLFCSSQSICIPSSSSLKIRILFLYFFIFLFVISSVLSYSDQFEDVQPFFSLRYSTSIDILVGSCPLRGLSFIPLADLILPVLDGDLEESSLREISFFYEVKSLSGEWSSFSSSKSSTSKN